MHLSAYLLLCATTAGYPAEPLLLDKQLAAEDPASLAKAARTTGDVTRGALLFHQPALACAKCHTDEPSTAVGPDLTRPAKDVTDAHLVESVLQPSRLIRKGYEPVTVVTAKGKTITGILVEERADALVLREAAGDLKTLTIPKADIEERAVGKVSLMPEGLVNTLADRGQFLDLVRYLMEIAEKGPDRARELRPPAALLAVEVPAYEKDIDHARILSGLDGKSFRRGEAIYNRLCINCHGTKDQPGSLPTSLRFASGTFKNGSDPYRMYQTLTHGYGMMMPQTWMVPRQKYDVIHYVREAYLKQFNPSQYVAIDRAYLDRLPRGSSLGPEPVNAEPWVTMNYGPYLINTYEADPGNFAYKGIAVRLDAGPGGVSRGHAWTVFDHDTLRTAADWTGSGFIDWNGIHFNGRHQVHPKIAGTLHATLPVGPGWADPATGSFDDPRLRGRDGKPYGPLPWKWAHYRGLYHFGPQVVIAYTVGDTSVLESPGVETSPSLPKTTIFMRTLELGPVPKPLTMRVAGAKAAVALVGGPASLERKDGFTLLRVPAASDPRRLKLLVSDGDESALTAHARTSPPPQPLLPLTKGGPRQWPELLTTTVQKGQGNGTFVVDVLPHPDKNPWFCQIRLTGIDFYPDGDRAAVCAWDGDVWIVSGLLREDGKLTWQRIASGLFQPLGVKIVDGVIHCTCRDQLVRLHDLNGDGETDFYENVNNDHQVTEHFHEFAMGLQTDAEGNFYYAKSARHALPPLVPHHGTLLKILKDGSATEILATGFRAANGVCLNPDGSFFVTDQEGHWTPKNRINWVTPGGFYGNMWGYHDVTDKSDAAMKQPLCWITNKFDRSPAELLWVDSPAWGPLRGKLLNLSYGNGQVYVVPHERVGDQMQGGMCAFPLPVFPTGIMRGRFHPTDGQLYTCGMFAWAGNRQQPGGFYRIRYTSKPVYLPVGLHARKQGMEITFASPVDPTTAADVQRYSVQTWSLKRSAQYGSKHFDEKKLTVTRASVSDDGRTVFLEMPDIRPTWCMEIAYRLKGATGEAFDGTINNTVHTLGK